MAPPQPPGALPPPTDVLTRLKQLEFSCHRMTDAGCAALVAALDSGALPALERLRLYGPGLLHTLHGSFPGRDTTPAEAAVQEALAK